MTTRIVLSLRKLSSAASHSSIICPSIALCFCGRLRTTRANFLSAKYSIEVRFSESLIIVSTKDVQRHLSDKGYQLMTIASNDFANDPPADRHGSGAFSEFALVQPPSGLANAYGIQPLPVRP